MANHSTILAILLRSLTLAPPNFSNQCDIEIESIPDRPADSENFFAVCTTFSSITSTSISPGYDSNIGKFSTETSLASGCLAFNVSTTRSPDLSSVSPGINTPPSLVHMCI